MIITGILQRDKNTLVFAIKNILLKITYWLTVYCNIYIFVKTYNNY